MKKQTSTSFCLIVLFFLLITAHAWAQRNDVLNPATKKQNPTLHLQPCKTDSKAMNKWAAKYKIQQNLDRSSKLVSKLSAQKKASNAMNLSYLKDPKRIAMWDSTKRQALKPVGRPTLAKTPAPRPKSFAARKSADVIVPHILHVSMDGSGLKDGTSWDNAMEDFAEALQFARTYDGVEEIWVANGIYYPRYDHLNRTDGDEGHEQNANVFMLIPDIKIYGGFNQTENSVAERTLRLLPSGASLNSVDEPISTILSGDYYGDDYNSFAENAGRIILSAGDVGTASLDGFIVTGGAGGRSVITLEGYNLGSNYGGGIVAINSSPSLTNLLITGNSTFIGSAIFTYRSNFVLTNTLVEYNQCARGTFYLEESSPVITNATITKNGTAYSGPGMHLQGPGNAKIRNSIIYGNTPLYSASLYLEEGATASSSHNIIQYSGGSTSWNLNLVTDEGGNLDTDPLFRGTYPGLRPTSPAVNTGNSELYEPSKIPNLSAITTDQRGTPRKKGPSVDMGALESLYGNLVTDLVPSEDGILYVKKGSNGNGSSWTNAAGEVADALFAAALNDNIDNIWVAGGTYHPLYHPDDLTKHDKSRFNAFSMVEGVSLYGGFAGGELTLEARNLALKENASILSGDFNKDDNFDFTDFLENGPDESTAENALHLIYAVSLGESGPAMNGFTIQGANNITTGMDEDAPLGSIITLVNETEISVDLGAGILIVESSPLFENLIVRNNLGFFGGGITAFNADMSITNSLVYENFDYALSSGIAIFGSIKRSVMLNTTVTKNISLGGPCVATVSADLWIYNSIIQQNITINTDIFPLNPNFLAYGTEGEVSNSIIGGSGGSLDWQLENNFEGLDMTDLGGNLDEDPVFADYLTNDFSLSQCSPAIDAGNASRYEANTLPATDQAGNPRIFNNILDMGALELQALRNPDVKTLAENGQESNYFFANDGVYHTFSANGEVCNANLLTLIPIELSGNVNAKVWVDNKIQNYNGAVYLQRHFDINPSDNPESSSGRVVLYFTQKEFDALNLLLNAPEYLPTGESEGEEDRKANLRIYQFHGPSTDDSGSPDSYKSTRREIDPNDEDIQWNAVLNRWEVAFDMSGFSGFFAGTGSQNPLPVKLVSFEGKRTDDQKTRLDWKVTEQESIEVYQIEYSQNGKSFAKIGQIMANKLTSTDYTYSDSLSHAGNRAYYRLKIVEADGKAAYSRIISVRLPETEQLIAYPVPAKNDLWIDWKKADATSLQLIDYTGRVLKTVKKSGSSQKVDISGLPAGMFILKNNRNQVLKVVKE